MRILAQQYDTLDAMCWRYYGRTEGVTEKVLAANPGLADIGPVLPHGLQTIRELVFKIVNKKTGTTDAKQ